MAINWDTKEEKNDEDGSVEENEQSKSMRPPRRTERPNRSPQSPPRRSTEETSERSRNSPARPSYDPNKDSRSTGKLHQNSKEKKLEDVTLSPLFLSDTSNDRSQWPYAPSEDAIKQFGSNSFSNTIGNHLVSGSLRRGDLILIDGSNAVWSICNLISKYKLGVANNNKRTTRSRKDTSDTDATPLYADLLTITKINPIPTWWKTNGKPTNDSTRTIINTTSSTSGHMVKLGVPSIVDICGMHDAPGLLDLATRERLAVITEHPKIPGLYTKYFTQLFDLSIPLQNLLDAAIRGYIGSSLYGGIALEPRSSGRKLGSAPICPIEFLGKEFFAPQDEYSTGSGYTKANYGMRGAIHYAAAIVKCPDGYDTSGFEPHVVSTSAFKEYCFIQGGGMNGLNQMARVWLDYIAREKPGGGTIGYAGIAEYAKEIGAKCISMGLCRSYGTLQHGTKMRNPCVEFCAAFGKRPSAGQFYQNKWSAEGDDTSWMQTGDPVVKGKQLPPSKLFEVPAFIPLDKNTKGPMTVLPSKDMIPGSSRHYVDTVPLVHWRYKSEAFNYQRRRLKNESDDHYNNRMMALMSI